MNKLEAYPITKDTTAAEALGWTPEQKTARMVEAILTSTTCGEGCWYAREQVCRCSCGGKNHGCLLDGSAERPARTSKIHGTLYQLSAVGRYGDLAKQADAELRALPPRDVSRTGYTYHWRPTDPGAPVYLKCATKQQLGAWQELKDAARGTYLLWKIIK
jgi:hypothetical protein